MFHTLLQISRFSVSKMFTLNARVLKESKVKTILVYSPVGREVSGWGRWGKESAEETVNDDVKQTTRDGNPRAVSTDLPQLIEEG